MPIPGPKKQESKNDFVSRCISSIYEEYKNTPGQAAAICEGKWRDKTKKASSVIATATDEFATFDESTES